jgi:predicted DNA-binding transcriptional regulator AlpA
MSQGRILTDKLVEYFDDLNIGVKELQDATGLSKSVCYKLMNQEVVPSVETIRRIKTAYPKISLSYLFSRE